MTKARRPRQRMRLSRSAWARGSEQKIQLSCAWSFASKMYSIRQGAQRGCMEALRCPMHCDASRRSACEQPRRHEGGRYMYVGCDEDRWPVHIRHKNSNSKLAASNEVISALSYGGET